MKSAAQALQEIQRFIKDNPSKIEEFWSKVNKDGPKSKPNLTRCWQWMGKISNKYGYICHGTVPLRAHRLSFILHGGEVSDISPHVLHSCDNTMCVNPEHLRAGTPQDNANDKVASDRQSRGEKHSKAIAPFVNRGPTWSEFMQERSQHGEEHHNHILTEDQVREIRSRYAAGGIFYRELAEEYGVHRVTIGEVVRRVLWNHIT